MNESGASLRGAAGDALQWRGGLKLFESYLLQRTTNNCLVRSYDYLIKTKIFVYYRHFLETFFDNSIVMKFTPTWIAMQWFDWIIAGIFFSCVTTLLFELYLNLS